MKLKSEPPRSFSVQEVLNNGENYVIPMYQRNYAWGESEVTQLIQDVLDYLPKENEEPRNYYLGTLVVFERSDGRLETIDGQQRLTTLSLLAAYLKNEESDMIKIDWFNKLNLHFDSRPNSKNTLTAIFNNQIANLNLDKPEDSNTAILNGHHLIKKLLPLKIKENKTDLKQFAKFLFEHVQIMRVNVPKDTDLNHYFEIMNNRGEQLEKHEVLKSRMMEALKDDKESQNCLHMVWEACANMEKYLQMGFSPKQRDAIFGAKDWGRFDVNNFEVLREKISQSTDELPDRASEQTLDEIIGQARGDVKQSRDDEAPERFNTVINFPNFLLHVLRVQIALDVPLDDKRLISTFEVHMLKGDDAAAKVKKFTFDLLRCKFLYDQHIIKREFIKGTDGWSLKRLKWNDGGATNRAGHGYYVNTFGDEDANGADNRRILMLLSAFHVSTPTLVYKHWLNAALHYLFTVDTVRADTYLVHLESVAKSFVFDRFLSANGGLDYFEIIYQNKGVCQTRQETISENDMETKLSFGNIENNLVFNFLDYLLWFKHQASDTIVKNYEFTFRSSVEHYYPQHPLPGHDSLQSDALNSFGNLCLISHSKNSRLSNFMPETKKEYYRNNTIDSVKQYFMMDDQRWPRWNKSSIKSHFKEMKQVLLNALVPTEKSE